MEKFQLDIASIPNELNVILQILRNQNSYSPIPTRTLSSFHWKSFIRQAKHHRVFPVLYKKIKDVDQFIVPKEIIQEFEIEYRQNTFMMLKLSAEIDLINRLFSEEAIKVLFLKGPVIAHDLYGDISLRTSSDLDFLIQIKDLQRAEKILMEMGYIKNDYIKSVLNDWKWRHHHFAFYHPQKRIKLEIHWRLNPGPNAEQSFNELWKRKRNSNLTNTNVFYLGKEDLFVFLISHGSRHGWSRLRWLLDIHYLLHKDIDWNLVKHLLRKYQLTHIAGQALLLSNFLLHTKYPHEIKFLVYKRRSRKLAQDAIFYLERMVNLHTEPLPDEVASYHSRHLFSLKSMNQKLLFIISLLFPFSEDAETLPLPKRMHFLYFPLRPFLCAWRRARKHV